MDWYTIHGKHAASFWKLPYETAEPGTPELFLVRGDPGLLPAAWRVTDPRQLMAEAADVRTWLRQAARIRRVWTKPSQKLQK